jgi:DNA repair protein RadA/Sms
MGRCNQCGLWNTLEEDILEEEKNVHPRGPNQARPMDLHEIPTHDAFRKASGIGELDRVLGGGVVEGSFVLIGGDPGIGKSTLMLQMAHRLAASHMKVLYVSGEESALQLKMRAQRLGMDSKGIMIYPEVEIGRAHV